MSYRKNAEVSIDVSTEQPVTFDRLRAVIDQLERLTAEHDMTDVHITHIEMGEWDGVFTIGCGSEWITQVDHNSGVVAAGVQLGDLPDTRIGPAGTGEVYDPPIDEGPITPITPEEFLAESTMPRYVCEATDWGGSCKAVDADGRCANSGHWTR